MSSILAAGINAIGNAPGGAAGIAPLLADTATTAARAVGNAVAERLHRKIGGPVQEVRATGARAQSHGPSAVPSVRHNMPELRGSDVAPGVFGHQTEVRMPPAAQRHRAVREPTQPLAVVRPRETMSWAELDEHAREADQLARHEAPANTPLGSTIRHAKNETPLQYAGTEALRAIDNAIQPVVSAIARTPVGNAIRQGVRGLVRVHEVPAGAQRLGTPVVEQDSADRMYERYRQGIKRTIKTRRNKDGTTDEWHIAKTKRTRDPVLTSKVDEHQEREAVLNNKKAHASNGNPRGGARGGRGRGAPAGRPRGRGPARGTQRPVVRARHAAANFFAQHPRQPYVHQTRTPPVAIIGPTGSRRQRLTEMHEMSRDGNSVTVTGEDYLTGVTVTSANNVIGGPLITYDFNPAQAITLCLRQYANLFQKFQFLGFEVDYAGSQSYNVGGSINVLFDSDAADNDGTGVGLVQQAGSTSASHIVPVIGQQSWHYNPGRDARGRYYMEIDRSDKANTRQTVQAHFIMFVVNPISGATLPVTIGSCTVRYKVRMYHRQVVPAVQTGPYMGIANFTPSATPAGDLFNVGSMTTNTMWSQYVTGSALSSQGGSNADIQGYMDIPLIRGTFLISVAMGIIITSAAGTNGLTIQWLISPSPSGGSIGQNGAVIWATTTAAQTLNYPSTFAVINVLTTGAVARLTITKTGTAPTWAASGNTIVTIQSIGPIVSAADYRFEKKLMGVKEDVKELALARAVRAYMREKGDVDDDDAIGLASLSTKADVVKQDAPHVPQMTPTPPSSWQMVPAAPPMYNAIPPSAALAASAARALSPARR